MSDQLSSLKPLGIFWDINNCFIPLTLTTNECIKHLRIFITNHFNNNCIEYHFYCLFDPKLINHSIIQSLKGNGCAVLHMDSNSEINVFITLDQMVKQFVEKYGSDTNVVIISNNSSLSPIIQLLRHKEVSVLLISDQKPVYLTSKDWTAFDDVFELNRTVILSITNIPNKSRKTIRDSFIPFCQQFNCKFRFNRREFVRLEFNNANDAKRAQIRLKELKLFGHDLNVEFIECEDNANEISLSVCSSIGSVISLTKNGPILPQNDDKCKSVIIGLFTKYNQNVHKVVCNIVNGWNDPSVTDSMIHRVNRERDLTRRDGRASLIVTAIDRQSNTKIISVAKQLFVDRDNKLYWNALQRSKRVSATYPNCFAVDKTYIKDIPIDCKSIITGLWTKSNENVLKTVRNLVKSWNIHGYDIRHIICVERSLQFNNRDGKASLVISTDSKENSIRILRFVSQKFESNCSDNDFSWKPFSANIRFDSEESLNESNDKYLSPKTDTSGSYASIASKSLIIENIGNSPQNVDLMKSNGINANFHRNGNLSNKCKCQ